MSTFVAVHQRAVLQRKCVRKGYIYLKNICMYLLNAIVLTVTIARVTLCVSYRKTCVEKKPNFPKTVCIYPEAGFSCCEEQAFNPATATCCKVGHGSNVTGKDCTCTCQSCKTWECWFCDFAIASNGFEWQLSWCTLLGRRKKAQWLYHNDWCFLLTSTLEINTESSKLWCYTLNYVIEGGKQNKTFVVF